MALLTGGEDPHYALGLARALVAQGIRLDVIGSDETARPEFLGDPAISYLNLRGDVSRDAGAAAKVLRVLAYYGRLIVYAWRAQPRVFHILWNNKFAWFDRTLLTCYYRLCGRLVTLTAHNVNAARRDGHDTWLNRVTLRLQYAQCARIFVHTAAMRDELIRNFGISAHKVCLIPYGVNDAVPETALTRDAARRRLGLPVSAKTLLFFGAIAPYKGLEYLVEAIQRLGPSDRCILIVAGRPKGGAQEYWQSVKERIESDLPAGSVMLRIAHIPDDDAEVYFKAADALVLPYTDIFQSGVLFFGYRFGLPAIAADVGSFRDDVIDGETGFVFAPRDSVALAETIRTYFSSPLFEELDTRRHAIAARLAANHSWETVATRTEAAYDGAWRECVHV